MIVAGIGCREGAPKETIIAAIDAALREHGTDRGRLGLLATGALKRNEPGLITASEALDVPLMIIDDARLQAAASRCLTHSPASLATAGVPSLSEASALVAAGQGGSLLGPRIALNGVTCALGITQAARKDAP